MKFVNKLTVLSLIVLMFSFMSVANADDCPPANPSSVCNTNKTQHNCLNNFTSDKNSSTGYSQCKWVNSKCYSGGNACYFCDYTREDDCLMSFNSKKPDESKK